MNKRGLILAGIAFCAVAAFVWAETDEEVEAHKQVLDLTGAFVFDALTLNFQVPVASGQKASSQVGSGL